MIPQQGWWTHVANLAIPTIIESITDYGKE